MSQLDHIPEIRLAAISITGPDALAFMQAQLTIDVESITDKRLYPAAWCNPDGRVDSVLLIALDEQRATLVLPEGLSQAMVKRAQMFSIGRQVKIENSLCVWPAAPRDPNDGSHLALSLDPERALTVGDRADAPEPDSRVLPAAWLEADIECGMPWILPETSATFLPQMLGLEALGGLSYKKGCFPGQEVIARVHYRGRVTRRLSRFRLEADRPPAPGAEFRLAEKPASVLYAVARGRERATVSGLAVVSAEAEDSADIDIGGSTGTLKGLC